MNRQANSLFSYGEGYHYQNADGSRFFSNPDGSSFYDPGPNGKGRKWYCSPDGVKHYIEDEKKPQAKVKYEKDQGDEETEFVGSPPLTPGKAA